MATKHFLLLSLLALGSLSICSADLSDNQIDSDQFGQRTTRGRFLIKGCEPCASNQCQVMGMQRYAEPRCEAFGGLGAPCRPFQEPENKTLSFPNVLLYCNDVYMQFCPCGSGLVCDPEEAKCKHDTTIQTQQQKPQVDGFHFIYSSPERYSYDVTPTFDSLEFEEEQDSMPIALEPMIYERQTNVRHQPQWPWAVARYRQ